MLSQKVDHRYAPVPMFASGVVECARRVEALGAASEADAIDLAIDGLYNSRAGEHDIVVSSLLSKEYGLPVADLLQTFWSVPEDMIPDRAADLPLLYETHRPELVAAGVARLEACHHVNLAFSTANKMAKKYQKDPDELVSMAYFGLQSALTKYNPATGYTVSTFVTHRIWGSIQDGLRNDSPVPKRLTTFVRQVKAAEEKLFTELRRDPTFSELRDELGPDAANLYLYPRLAPQESLTDMEDFFLPSDADETGMEVEARESQRIVQTALASLTPEEMAAVKHVHMDGLTTRQAAKAVRSTRAQLEMHLDTGLEKLRNVPEIVGLDPSRALAI